MIHGLWWTVWKHFKKRRLSLFALLVVLAFALVGLYAPFLASSKPLMASFNGQWYFPLFRYLFYSGFYTKRIDLFFNLLMFTAPVAVGWLFLTKNRPRWQLFGFTLVGIIQIALFLILILKTPKDPEADLQLARLRQEALSRHPEVSWSFDLYHMNNYAKLNLLLEERQRQVRKKLLQKYGARETDGNAETAYQKEKRQWLQEEQKNLRYVVMPPLRPYHWQDDAMGTQGLNQLLPWWELSRINGKDLMAALLFGVRISLVVGLVSVAIALSIAIPVGSLAGFYGGTFDIIISRLLEIWEAMPTFFMLLLVVAITQSKSIFLVISVIGLFGWTNFSRFLRGEFFKQRNLPYVEACRALGYRNSHIVFSHILPNAIPPLLTLLPFAIMGAITSEAGLSFLGLGEEGSCSWGVLMDEGRTAFPGQAYLLWPPAILLTLLLVAIALVGDGLRDALDPRN